MKLSIKFVKCSENGTKISDLRIIIALPIHTHLIFFSFAENSPPPAQLSTHVCFFLKILKYVNLD